ncbi:MAG: hypothetical protein HYV40_02970 [Candidatus Levybacteria bacterium]|nr:hypothetical protein [Candidatus Levybacteria bacterium]
MAEEEIATHTYEPLFSQERSSFGKDHVFQQVLSAIPTDSRPTQGQIDDEIGHRTPNGVEQYILGGLISIYAMTPQEERYRGDDGQYALGEGREVKGSSYRVCLSRTALSLLLLNGHESVHIVGRYTWKEGEQPELSQVALVKVGDDHSEEILMNADIEGRSVKDSSGRRLSRKERAELEAGMGVVMAVKDEFTKREPLPTEQTNKDFSPIASGSK